MVSRRNFLGVSGLGIVAASSSLVAGNSGCNPLLPQFFETSVSNDQRLERLQEIKPFKEKFLGYPVNMNTPDKGFFEWRKQLFKVGIDQFAFNNVGNPYKESPIPYSTHDFERDTIAHFGKTYRFPENNTWGFLSNSGTDSNMHGMYMGRTVLKERTGVTPIAYLTPEAHYSVQILCDLLGLKSVNVKTLENGGMDPNDLQSKLNENRDFPALVVATIGTTFKGAVDPLDPIQSVLTGRESYLHLDAALFGGYLPHTSYASEIKFRNSKDQQPRFHSIAVSCHKFFGFPAPAGLYLTTGSLYDEFNRAFSKIHNPEYIHQVPGTITCSRDSVKPAEFFYFTTDESIKRQQDDAKSMMKNTEFLHTEMLARHPKLNPVRSNPMSNTVYFRFPGENVVKKYSLATMNLTVGKQKIKHAHAIVMPHVTKEVINEFLNDLGASKSTF